MADKKSNKKTPAKMFTNPLYGFAKAKGKKSEDGKYDEKYLLKRMDSFTTKQPRLSGKKMERPQLPVAQNKKKKPSEGKYHRESIKRQESAEKWKFFDEESEKNPNFPRPPRGTPEDHGWSLEGVVSKKKVGKGKRRRTRKKRKRRRTKKKRKRRRKKRRRTRK